LLLLPASNRAVAWQVLQNLHQAVQQHDWAAVAPGLQISFSAGLAQHQVGETGADLLARADQALYRAKANGRNRSACCEHEPTLNPMPMPTALRPAAAATATASAATSATGRLHSRVAAPVGAMLPPAVAASPAPAPHSAPTRPAWQPLAAWLHLVRAPLLELVLGHNPKVREALRLPLVASVLHTVWILVVLVYAIPAQEISYAAGMAAVVFECACAVFFYAAIRSGFSQRFADPLLVLPQMLAAMSVAAYGYVVAPALRPSLLHVMCVAQIFGMYSLVPRASKQAAIAGVLVLLPVAAWLGIQQPPDVTGEAIKLALGAFVIGYLGWLATRYSRVRQQVAAQHVALSQAVSQVHEQLIHDALTGLVNRQHMQEHLNLSHSLGAPYAVALIDIDYFKRVNDQLGHPTGDAVLQGLADLARRTLANNEMLCRWGGEEFLLWVPGPQGQERAATVLMQLRVALADLRFGQAGTPAGALRVSFSAGLAQAQSAETPDKAVERADRALYVAKAAGRNRDVLADTAQTDQPGWPTPPRTNPKASSATADPGQSAARGQPALTS
jgi:diguanylate cyclase